MGLRIHMDRYIGGKKTGDMGSLSASSAGPECIQGGSGQGGRGRRSELEHRRKVVRDSVPLIV